MFHPFQRPCLVENSAGFLLHRSSHPGRLSVYSVRRRDEYRHNHGHHGHHHDDHRHDDHHHDDHHHVHHGDRDHVHHHDKQQPGPRQPKKGLNSRFSLCLFTFD